MRTDDDAAYQAFVAKDARFDGRVFVGVTSTGVYCRPICRVRTPKRANCRFFSTPELAEAARFRPCLKCRPEIAPQASDNRWSVMDASRTLAWQAAALLDAQLAAPQGDAAGAKLAALARQLGISDRHLRRIFLAEMGVTPLQYLQTRRLLLAKGLLTDSSLPVTQVALASGFGSVRRFNAAFSEAYRLTPSRLREAGAASKPQKTGPPQAADGMPGDSISLRLGYRAPYDMARLGRFLAQRAIPGIEEVLLPADAAGAGLCLRRSLRGAALRPGEDNTGVAAGWLQAWFDPRAPQVRLDFSAHWMPHAGTLLHLVRRWLDLDAAPDAIEAVLRDDLPGQPGLRLPGSLDGFELAVRAVLGQQVTVAAARTLATRLVHEFGAPLATPWPGVDRSFVEPETLAALPPQQLCALGLTGARARTLVNLAAEWPRLAALLQEVAVGRASVDALIATLCELPGIGPWTAHYLAMRALSWPDAALPGDVALRKAMQQRFGTETQRAAEERALAWRPWRSYAALRLWNSLVPGDGAAATTTATTAKAGTADIALMAANPTQERPQPTRDRRTVRTPEH